MLDALCHRLPPSLQRYCGPLRMAAWALAISLLFYVIGRLSAPVILPAMCKIYG